MGAVDAHVVGRVARSADPASQGASRLDSSILAASNSSHAGRGSCQAALLVCERDGRCSRHRDRTRRRPWPTAPARRQRASPARGRCSPTFSPSALRIARRNSDGVLVGGPMQFPDARLSASPRRRRRRPAAPPPTWSELTWPDLRLRLLGARAARYASTCRRLSMLRSSSSRKQRFGVRDGRRVVSRVLARRSRNVSLRPSNSALQNCIYGICRSRLEPNGSAPSTMSFLAIAANTATD